MGQEPPCTHRLLLPRAAVYLTLTAVRNQDAIFIYSPEMDDFRYPPDCPFKPERVKLTREKLASFGLLRGSGRQEVPARKATRTELERFHLPAYLDELDRAAGGELTVEALHMGLGTPDTPIFPDMVSYGAWACGATLTAAEYLRDDHAHYAFSPSGGLHHAGASSAGGFCYLNDVVLGCIALADAGKRVLFLDIDAHHADGVQDAFYTRSDVMVMSMHQSGKTLFPWRGFEDEVGEGPGRGYTVNIPVPPHTYDDAFLRAFSEVAKPLIDAFGPDILVVEVGMDTLAGDPLVQMDLTNNAMHSVIKQLMETGIPILVTGGGGYHVENTVRGWALAWQTLCNDDDGHDLSLGLGGVMLGSADWQHGLRDPARMPAPAVKDAVDLELNTSLATLKRTLFPLHGLA
jgi:acetoin utilization protein AcuC